ncbi:MAG: LysR family transcriptional regulator [Rhodoferax sp.]|nr:LysR family transcriptional regulator [Rhodoferax sp.]
MQGPSSRWPNWARSPRQPCVCVAQPALSRQISNLEQELGLKLFDRVGRRLVLTGEGEQLLGDCRDLLICASAIGERAQLLRGGDTGTLRVAASPQFIEVFFWLPAPLRRTLSPGPVEIDRVRGMDRHPRHDGERRDSPRPESVACHCAHRYTVRKSPAGGGRAAGCKP